MIKLFRLFIDINQNLSRLFDRLFFIEKFRISGEADFTKNIVPKYFTKGQHIYDVGGGKCPFLNIKDKKRLKVTVIGIDISQEELDKAPKGAYDATIQNAIENVIGNHDGDLVICKAVLEHVLDSEKALLSIYSLLKPGGIALIFVPSENALFARMNRILPDSFRRKILFTIYPDKLMSSGFPAYYKNCTPKQFSKMALACGFSIIEERCYYWSSYFSFLLPLYILWRIWLILFYALAGKEAAEGFAVALKK